jgi:hypothetical protein
MQRKSRLCRAAAVMLCAALAFGTVALTVSGSAGAAGVVQIKRRVIDVGLASAFSPRRIVLDETHRRMLLVDPDIGELRAYTYAGRLVRRLRYDDPHCGGWIEPGPHETLYSATSRAVVVRSERTFAVLRRIPLPSFARSRCEKTVGLAGRRIWVPVIGRAATAISTSLSSPGRWTREQVTICDISGEGAQGATASSPYLVSTGDVPYVSRVDGTAVDNLPHYPDGDGIDGSTVLTKEGFLAVSAYLPDPDNPNAAGFSGSALFDERHPRRPLQIMANPLAPYPVTDSSVDGMSPNHRYVAIGMEDVQVLQRWDAPRHLEVIPIVTRQHVHADVTAFAMTGNGAKMFVTTIPHRTTATSHLELGIYDVNVSNW